jgi:hypothetical protein
MKLLEILLERPGEVVTREEFGDLVFEWCRSIERSHDRSWLSMTVQMTSITFKVWACGQEQVARCARALPFPRAQPSSVSGRDGRGRL